MDATATPEAPARYTATEACQLAGITYRQLDYWARNGKVKPSIAEAAGSGSQRLYSSYDVAELRVLGRLTALGFKPAVQAGGVADLLDHLLVELHALEPLTKGAAYAQPSTPDPPARHRAPTDHRRGH